MNSILKKLILCTASLTMIGCSTPKVVVDPGQMRIDSRAVTIRHGDGSGEALWDAVIADMASAKAVLIGEMHGHELGLAVAAELFDDLVKANDQTSLSMEFYERDEQLAIDDYLAGITDRTAFEKASNRSKGNNPPGHEQMVETAKAANRSVTAANAPRRYTKIARKEGFDSLRELNDRQKDLFNIPPSLRMDTAYKDRFFDAMSGMAAHGGDEMIKGFYRSQTLWDRTMATSIARAAWQGSPVVHMVGYFHIQFGTEPGGSGLVDDLYELLAPGDRVVTFVMLDRSDQPIVEDDLGIADYVIYVGTDEEEE
jgi:uncharacterized iron-regulated protein